LRGRLDNYRPSAGARISPHDFSASGSGTAPNLAVISRHAPRLAMAAACDRPQPQRSPSPPWTGTIRAGACAARAIHRFIIRRSGCLGSGLRLNIHTRGRDIRGYRRRRRLGGEWRDRLRLTGGTAVPAIPPVQIFRHVEMIGPVSAGVATALDAHRDVTFRPHGNPLKHAGLQTPP
jgi:hypothetical protein